MNAKMIGRDDESGISFWLIGGEVYRLSYFSGLDSIGAPLGKRWECSYDHWQTFRSAFSWAQDVTT